MAVGVMSAAALAAFGPTVVLLFLTYYVGLPLVLVAVIALAIPVRALHLVPSRGETWPVLQSRFPFVVCLVATLVSIAVGLIGHLVLLLP